MSNADMSLIKTMVGLEQQYIHMKYVSHGIFHAFCIVSDLQKYI